MNNRNRTKEEKVKLVMQLIKKLKYFPRSDFFTCNDINNAYVDLFNINYPAIKELKKSFDEYINNDYSVSGKIKFDEINRRIEFNLPIKSYIEPLFVLKQM